MGQNRISARGTSRRASDKNVHLPNEKPWVTKQLIVTLGGLRIGDAAQQWYVAPLTNSTGKVTVQNAGRLQYRSVPGVPANDTAVAPSAELVVWKINQSGQQVIIVDGACYLTDRVGVVPVSCRER